MLLILLIFTTILGCRRVIERPNWNVDVVGPIIKTDLNLNHLLNSNILSTDADNAYHLFYKQDLYKLKVDSLFSLPDTPNVKYFNIPIGPLTFAPSQVLESDTENTVFGLKGVKLVDLEFKSGFFEIEITNQIEEVLLFEYELLGASKNGAPFKINMTIPAASSGNLGSVTQQFDLSEYALDLRGNNLNSFNVSAAVFKITVDPNGDAVSISKLDTVAIKTKFIEAIPEFAKGYFQNQNVVLNKQYSEIDAFDLFKSGQLNVLNPTIKLYVENEIGMDLRASNLLISGINSANNNSVDLNTTFNTINISRAYHYPSQSPTFKSSYVEVDVNIDNSNLSEVLSSMPDKLSYELNLEINPLGNISGNNDFIYYNTGLKLGFEIDIPLQLAVTDLVIEDTVDYEFAEEKFYNAINSGYLNLLLKNYFPFDLTTALLIFDENMEFVDSLTTNLTIATPYQPGDYWTLVPIEIKPETIDNLTNGSKMLISSTLNLTNTEGVSIVSGESDFVEIVLVSAINVNTTNNE